jgi:predicted ATPase
LGGVGEGRSVVAPAAALRPSAEWYPTHRAKSRAMDGAPGAMDGAPGKEPRDGWGTRLNAHRKERTPMLVQNQPIILDAPVPAIENGGYLMIQTLSIKNFRCFKELKSLSLKRFNVFVGESGSGKTTLLESMFLLGGATPEIYFRIRNWRGFGTSISFSGSRASYESLFKDMFYNFSQEKAAFISSVDSNTGLRSLEISYRDKDEYSLDLNLLDSHAFLIVPLQFKWSVAGKFYTSSLEMKEGKFSITGSAPVAPLAYYNAINANATQTATAYSDLSKKFRTSKLTDSISQIFPNVRDLSLEIVAGETILHVSTDLSERLPLGDLSGGISKFVTIALGILANPGGVVAVDEIESGFYYRNMPEIWASLVKLAQSENVQLIVTTHSYEFLKAVAANLNEESVAKDTQIMRLEKDVSGEHIVKKISLSAFGSAIEYEMEVR